MALQRWPHDDAQQRRSVVLQWGDGSMCEEERLEPGWVWLIMGCSRCSFYYVVARRKAGGQGQGGSGGGTSMTSVT
jgi:hypothetical protein